MTVLTAFLTRFRSLFGIVREIAGVILLALAFAALASDLPLRIFVHRREAPFLFLCHSEVS